MHRIAMLAVSLAAWGGWGCQSAPSAPHKAQKTSAGPEQSTAAMDLAKAMSDARANRLDEALQAAKSSAKKDPSAIKAFLLWGSICGMQSKLSCAETAYTTGLRHHPKNPSLHNELGLVKLEQGQADAAIKYLRTASKLSPAPDAKVLADLAYALVTVGKYSEAIPLATQASTLDPKCVECQMSLGQAYLSSKDGVKAASAFEEALKLVPNEASIQLKLAASYRVATDYDKALAAYDAITAQGLEAKVSILKADTLVAAGRNREASKILKALLVQYPNEEAIKQRLQAAEQGTK